MLEPLGAPARSDRVRTVKTLFANPGYFCDRESRYTWLLHRNFQAIAH